MRKSIATLAMVGAMLVGGAGAAGAVTVSQDDGRDGRGQGNYQNDNRSWRGGDDRDYRGDRRNRFDVYTLNLSGVRLDNSDAQRVRALLRFVENRGYDGVRLVGASDAEVRLVQRIINRNDIDLRVFGGNWNWNNDRDWNWNFGGNYRYNR